MKRLRDAPIRSGSPNDLSSAMPGERDDALLRRLAEADAGVEHDLVARDAGAVGDRERTGEERRDVGHDVDRRVGSLAIVHDDHRNAALRDHARHVGVALQAPDVVGDGGPGVERPGGDRWPSWCRSRPECRAPAPWAGWVRAAAFPRRPTPPPRRHRDGSIPRRYRGCRRLRPPAGGHGRWRVRDRRSGRRRRTSPASH